ncbi:MAG: hypothetical protein ACI4Q6_04790 [Huintestinicola sp.]
MNIRKIAGCFAAFSAALLMSGCGLGAPAENLLVPPMLSDGQKAIYEALEDAAGRDISLVYPRSGAYRSAFVFHDLDDDGSDEAVVFYMRRGDDSGSVRVNIMGFDGSEWHSLYDHAGAGPSVEQVSFTDPAGDGRTCMAVGYSYMSPKDKMLKIYSFSDGVLKTEYSESYYRTMRLDLDRDGSEDIIIINADTENHGAYVSLVSDRGNGIECVGTAELVNASADIPSAIKGYIGSSTPAVFVDGLSAGGNLSTEIIYCVNGELRNPSALENSELPSLTSRINGLYCADIDGDGIVEIPSREPFPGYRDGNDIQYITNWNVFEDYTITKKYSSLTSASKGYCFTLPVRWEGQVTVKKDSSTGEEVFYIFNSNLPRSSTELMRIAVCSSSEAEVKTEQGYRSICENGDTIYMVRFGDSEDNLMLTEAEVENNFYLY